MAEKCERCEQLEQLAQAYQDALKSTFFALRIALQPDTPASTRAEMLKRIEEGPSEGPQDDQGASEEPLPPSEAKKG